MNSSTLRRSLIALVGAVAVALPTAAQALPAAPVAPAASPAAALPASVATPAKAPVTTAKPSAGPDTAELADHLLDQEITWKRCNFAGSYPGLALECASIVVPRDWHNPKDGNTITLGISRALTAGENREGIALVNPGGPSVPGVSWSARMATIAPELAQEYDFYGFDPRGVNSSTALLCFYSPDEEDTPEEDLQAQVEGCLDNPLTPFINTEQTAYDMDFIRALAGEEKLSYIGYSYGTWLGKWYQTVFPHHSHRFLLDSSTALTEKSLQETWDLQPRSRDRLFQDRLLPYVARNADYFGAPSDDPMELRRYWELAGGTRSETGGRITGRYIAPAFYDSESYSAAAQYVGLYTQLGKSNEEAGITAEQAQQVSADEAEAIVAEMDATVLANPQLSEDERAWILERQAAAGEQEQLADDRVLLRLVFEVIRCQDGQWNQSAGYWDAWLADLGRKAPWVAPLMEAPMCRFWDATTSMPKVTGNSYPETLMLQSELDGATPYDGAVAAAQRIQNISMISIDNESSHALYPYGTECVDDAVNAYMLEGTLPEEKFTACQGKPLPREDETFEVGGALGKHGKIKLKMITPEVREANQLYKEMLREGLLDLESTP